MICYKLKYSSSKGTCSGFILILSILLLFIYLLAHILMVKETDW